MHAHDGLGVSESRLPYSCVANVRPPFPKDLRIWVGQSELGEMVTEVVDEIEDGNSPRKLLLGVIIYSYVTGIYGSEEIIRSLDESQSLWRFTNEVCGAGDIRNYRRNHRSNIERCVAKILRQARHRGEFSAEDFAREAAERVNRAIREDHWDLDF